MGNTQTMISPRSSSLGSSLGLISPQDLALPAKFQSFYPWQESAILHLAASDPRFSLVAAPPGTGKTPMAISIAILRGDRILYLTPNRGLEDQLMVDFSSIGMFDIRGHSNYPCASTSYDEDGELSDLSCQGRQRNGECNYRNAVDIALQRQFVCSNLAHWIMLQRADDPDRLGPFDLLVIDEAHRADDILVSSLVVKLYARTVHEYLSLDILSASASISEWRTWAKEAYSTARSVYRKISLANPNDNDSRLPRLTKLGRDLSRFLSHSEHSPWVVEETPFRGANRRGIILSPVWGKDYAEEYLFRGIERVLLTSATITPDTAKYLSIPLDIKNPTSDTESAAEFYEIPSAFDPKRRPLIYLPPPFPFKPIRVQHNNTESQKQIWMRLIDSILESRLDRKAIVHSLSYRRARDIVSRSRLSVAMLSHDPGETSDCVNTFLHSSPPSILVSPAVEEGYDFANDTCRLQILPKIPFIDCRGPILQARVKDDPKYKDYLTAQRIIQIAGRPVRNSLDWAESFIVDAHWIWFRTKVTFPKWFRAAWRMEKSIPKAPQFK